MASPHAASPHAYDAGLLLFRLTVGLTMAAHGSQKLFGWFGGGGLDGTGQFFTMSGYPSGRTMAALAGVSEALGGLGLAVGLLTPLAGAAIVGTMVNALAVKWGGGFFAPQGIEYELLLAAAGATLALTGSGRLAADRFLPGLRRHRLVYGGAAVLLGLVGAGIVLLLRK
ncbi:DoxX family membrane protein [Streptomyces sp. H10-C2]|uniref:DoxX family protein n=1 Tax=unclassified Streptomyces TaxID=2593676 RepID=UPI0024B9A766|nr:MULTISPECIES: DoxX family membrane protein [unclassified Streptomyces]MDJ0343433.1 DoxX family membrane protein [Streptomyces sp. PH10-H1]MDJ0371513.1 DoxX family membrane protein [Streptomyces sp. H10-C2]